MRRSFAVPALAGATLLLALTVGGCTSTASLGSDAIGQPKSGSGSVWVADEAGNSLTVLDAPTGAPMATFVGLPAPHNVQAGADGKVVWAVSGSNQVLALDVASLQVTAMAPTDRHPAHVVADAGGRVHVTSSGQPSLYTYDAQLRPIRRTRLSGAPHGLRIDAAGRTAVVANTGAGTVDVVDLAAGRIQHTIAVGQQPVQVALDAAGEVAHVSLAGSHEVVRVDLRTRAITHRATVPAAPAQVLLVGDLVLSADQGTQQAPGNTVSVLRADDLKLLARVKVGSGPHGLTADAAGRRLWVTNTFDDSITEVDLATRAVVRTVRVGDAPNGISFSPTSVRPAGTIRLELPMNDAHGGGEAPDQHHSH
jgi:YVTN family beta-propeller protein